MTGLTVEGETMSVEANNADLIPAQTAEQAVAVIPPEKDGLLPQDKVNDIVGHAKREAYEKGRRDSLAEMKIAQEQAAQNQQAQAQQQSMQQQPVQAAPPQTMQQQAPQGVQSHSPDDIQRIIDQRLQQHLAAQQETHAKQMADAEWQQTVGQFISKASPGMQTVPDFKEKVNNLNLENNRHILRLLNTVDNVPQVVEELDKNPSKLVTLDNLCRMNPNQAIMEMQRLSKSINANQAALQQASANEPLSQVKPSNVAPDDGSRTIKDMRKQSYLRV